MADDEVLQEFIADMAPYIDAIEEAVHAAHDFADANLEAKGAIDSMRDSSAETAGVDDELTHTLHDVRDALLEQAAAARIAAGETKKLRDDMAEAAVAAGAEGAAGGLAGALDSAGEALATAAAGGNGMVGMLAALAPIIAVAAIALTPFIAGLVTVTAGVGLFAAAAVPEISKVWTAISQGGSALKKLDPEERALVGPIRSLKSEFSGLQKAIQPEILKAFAEGLKIIKDVMPALRPLIAAAGQALDGFLKNIDQWLNSPGGKKFIQWLSVEGPMAMKTFGHDLWVTANDVGDVFHFMYDAGETFDRRWGLFWHNCTLVVDGFRSGFAEMGHLIESIWDQTVGYIIDTRGAVLTSWFQALPGRILGFLASLPGRMLSIGAQIIDGLLHGIESAAGGLLGYVTHLASDISGAFSKVLGIFSPSLVFHRHGLMLMAGLAAGIAAGYPAAVAAMRTAAAHLAGPSSPAGAALAGAGAGYGGSAAAAHGGAPPVVVNIYNAGSVIADQDLRAQVQRVVLDAWTRNRGTGFAPYGYGVH